MNKEGIVEEDCTRLVNGICELGYQACSLTPYSPNCKNRKILQPDGLISNSDSSIILYCTRCHKRATFLVDAKAERAGERAGWRIYNIGTLGVTLCPHCDYQLMSYLGQLKA